MKPRRRLAGLPSGVALFYSPSLDRELLLDFFMLFSRFECALKRAGYVRSLDSRSSAGADWDHFANDATEPWCFLGGPTLPATTFLASHPPSRQVVCHEKRISWEPSGRVDPTSLQQVLRLVRMVRNNLFHGGKYPAPQIINDPARNRELVEASLTVLQTCVALNARVKEKFPDDY